MLNNFKNMANNFDISKLSFFLNVSIIAAIFSVFSLIYNIEYIYYGLITFVYGVIAQLLELTFRHIFREGPDYKKFRILFFFQFVLIIVWLMVLLFIYR